MSFRVQRGLTTFSYPVPN